MHASRVGTTHLALWGPDHVVPGDVATAAAEPALAVALSCGAHPKARPSVDPNEDVAALAVGAGRSLLVVADGHGGQEAAVGAVHHLLESLDPLPWTLDEDAAFELLVGAARAAAAAGERAGQGRSRTTLLAALASGPDLWWASVGDSALFVVDAGGARRLDRPVHRFLGAPMGPAAVREIGGVGRAPLEPGAWVCLATDGYLDYARPDPGTALTEVLGGGPDGADPDGADPDGADAAARAELLVRRAIDGGAGDNVAVAVGRF